MEMCLISRGLVIMFLLVTIASCLIASERNIPVKVSRRLKPDGDIYWYLNAASDNINCHETYLVSEDRCVNDQELFNGNAYM